MTNVRIRIDVGRSRCQHRSMYWSTNKSGWSPMLNTRKEPSWLQRPEISISAPSPRITTATLMNSRIRCCAAGTRSHFGWATFNPTTFDERTFFVNSKIRVRWSRLCGITALAHAHPSPSEHSSWSFGAGFGSTDSFQTA